MTTDVVELLQDLIAADTVGKGERGLSELCTTLLSQAGLQTELIAFEAGREQLVAYAGGEQPLTLTGHLDVVPVNADDWDSDPFTARIDGDRLHGRGASDMKSGVAAMVVAVAEHCSDGHECRGVQVVLTAGEETGCTGAAEIDPAVLRRGGPLLVGEPTQNKPVIGHKGALWLRLQAHGTAAHGSAPHLGDNAAVRIARAAVALHDHEDWPHQDGFGTVTANVGVIDGGVQTNVVPDTAELELDLRYVPTVDPSDLRTTVSDLAGEQVTISDIVVLPPIDTAEDDAFVDLIKAALEDTSHEDTVPEPARFFTDASILSFALSNNGGAVPTVILGPGEPEQCHVANEWCSIDKLRESVDIYAAVLRRWCGAASSPAR